jgi:hypothetical protein
MRDLLGRTGASEIVRAVAVFATFVAACSSAGSAPGPTGTGGTGANGGAGGTGGKAGNGGSSQDGSGCPPECFVNNECVVACGDVPQDFGCCSCPANMIDARSCPADAAACGHVGGPCPGATECPGGLACVSGVCAPNASACAAPPGGVGCGTGQRCLQHAGQQEGICVTDDDRACLCAGFAASSFECAP